MTNARVARGRATQRMVASYLSTHGWPFARSCAAFESGEDVLGMRIEGVAGLSVEVKGTRDQPLLKALRQAVVNAGEHGLPVVVWRPDGYGDARLEDFVVAMRLGDAVPLWRQAGYGDPEPSNQETA